MPVPVRYRNRRCRAGLQSAWSASAFAPACRLPGHAGPCADDGRARGVRGRWQAWTDSHLDIQTFAHIAAHDLKAPMTGIASLVECLREDHGARLGTSGLEDLDLLQRLAERGVSLVDALKTYARVATTPMSPVALDMQALAADALAAVAARIGSATFAPGLTTDLPAACGDAALVPVLLEQVIHNAATFRREPDRHVEIFAPPSTRVPAPAGHAVYAVRDRGLGIGAAHLEAIFDLFKRLHGPDAFGGRAGAGLATCRLIVERHGGIIWAESDEYQGSTFFFTLPEGVPRPAPAP